MEDQDELFKKSSRGEKKEQQNSIKVKNAFAEPLVHTGTKEIVVFFGPPGVGKTVALIRLLSYMKTLGFTAKTSNATPSTPEYASAKENFESTMLNSTDSVPPATRGLDFLMLDIFKDGKLSFHILEAPGEHFFNPKDISENRYPRYMDQIFNSEQKKVFVLFFEYDMFKDAPGNRKRYSDRLASFINAKMDPSRDRLIVLYNKVNDQTHLWKGGKVQIEVLRNEIFHGPDYGSFAGAVQQNGTAIKTLDVIPFYSGDFYDAQSWSMSPDYFPKGFYSSIHHALYSKGGSSKGGSFWDRWF